MNRIPANKENVIPIPAHYPCQKDVGVRAGKRKAEANTQCMKENAATKRQNHGTLLSNAATAQQPTVPPSSKLGATSFAAIGNIIRQEQPPVPNARQEAQTSGVRTFADITSRSANAFQQEPQIDSSSRLEQLFSSGFSLHAEDASDHFNKAAAAALQEQQKAADQQPAALPSSSEPPLDWSIKTAVRFSSPEPFALAEEAVFISAGTASTAVRAFASCETDDMRSLQERYQSSTMSWQHPETCYPPATLAALCSGKANADLLEQRQAAWKDAFRGLYHALRHRQCDAFYLTTPLGAHQQKQNMVFFGAAGIAGRPCLHAIMSRSTLGLRTAMQQQYQLTFTIPLAPPPRKCHQGDPTLPDDLASLQTKGGTSGREQDNTRESLLYFEGPVEVQGLFEYLFNESRRFCGEGCDVPLLMAPVAFPSACLKQLHPKVLGASDSVKGKAVQHRLEMKGSIPPWVLDRFTGVIKDAHPAKFQMVAETAPLSGSFNVQPTSDASAVRASLSVFHAGGTANSLEAERWRSPPGQLANLVMRDLIYSDGQFVTRLTKCSTVT
ncbi:hypothetical protein WJX77_012634 [Trebouxia sp. C0004]